MTAPTPQFLLGRRASDGVYGAFLSRPGVDVRTASDDDLLITPFAANLAIIKRGIVYVAYGTVVTVYFDEPVSAPPMVFFSGMSGGSHYALPQLSSASSDFAMGDRFVVTTYVDRITIYNRLVSWQQQAGFSANALYVRYFVVARDAAP